MPTVSSSSASDAKKEKKAKIVVAVGVLVGTLALLSSLAGFAFYYTRRIKRFRRRLFGRSNACEELDLSLNQNTPQKFSYRDLSKATQDFHKRNLLGSGGFGAVYKGKLPSTGTEVAVKRISEESKQGVREFVSEVTTIGQLRHRNLVPLLGWCQEKGFMLVYELMPNGSLDRFLFEAQRKKRKEEEGDRALSWQMRLHILKGVAAAVNYLHEECEQKIVHRDIKTSNVMLDAGLNARLGDFGLARPYGHDAAPGTTNVAGTWGYIAPEAFYTRKATEKTDVFSFGALTLEVVTGKKICEHIDDEGCGLIEWLWRLHKDKRLFEAADPSMEMVDEKAADHAMLMHVLELGLSCCYAEPSCRPSMRYALQVLCGDVQPVPLPPSFSSPFYVSAELPQYFTSVSNSYGSDSVAPTRGTDSTDG
jgi:serine/threonine protein kinase